MAASSASQKVAASVYSGGSTSGGSTGGRGTSGSSSKVAGLKFSQQRQSLLSPEARVQAPWVKVVIGDYSFGIFDSTTRKMLATNGMYKKYNVQYPEYVTGLTVKKINGQVNQYSLTIIYPVTQVDDPNFFEKVFSSVSKSRKIVFTYGDAMQPAYIYKDEEAVITKVSQSFGFGGGGSMKATISYTVEAVSGAQLTTAGCMSFPSPGTKKPSDIIKDLFKNKSTGLQATFTGMSVKDLDTLIAGDDQRVEICSKQNVSVLDYITYLAGCMIADGTTTTAQSKDFYVLTMHDDTIYDQVYNGSETRGGPYFKITKTSKNIEHADAYEVNIGWNTLPIVTNFSIDQNENYSLYYDYQMKLDQHQYVKIIQPDGTLKETYSPSIMSKTDTYMMEPDEKVWWNKITQYPINASITVQGLLRPAMLMTYLRLNVIFPGGHKHIGSGLYLITSQTDTINESGYRTQLSLVKIAGDDDEVLGDSTANSSTSITGTELQDIKPGGSKNALTRV